MRLLVRLSATGLVALLCLGAATAAPAAVSGAGPSAVTPARTCGPGGTPALIAKRVRCLHTGAACDRTLETDYRRYGFTCVARRLRRG
ncbi:MAG: hypothetical protein R3C15_16375 [Thermoleophilia bacterium]